MVDGFPEYGNNQKGQSGWICDTQLCICVPIDGAGGGIYTSKKECEENCCPPPKNPGWNCVDTHSVDITNRYQCVYDGTQGEYKTKGDCEFRCGPGSVSRGTVPTRPTTPVPTVIPTTSSPQQPRSTGPSFNPAGPVTTPAPYNPGPLRPTSPYYR
jgi:hypothetical protein|tara:strand:+ start:754 stop:1221 length:468 start_codon:yes stop_codon:yes gene_type:complete